MALTQLNRNLAINTAAGQDQLLIRTASIVEQLSQPFRMEVELTSENPNLSFDKIIGTNATIRLAINGTEDRFFNGFVSRLVLTDADGEFARYHMTLVPWLWFLTRTSDCRVFLETTIPDIIKKVFAALGFSDYRLALTGTYDKWPNCVQYRETDFNFVSRLMEQEGIYYFFEHENGKHTLVLADSVTAHKAKHGTEPLSHRYNPEGNSGKDYVTNFVLEREVQPGSYVLNDFNFEKPKTSLKGQSDQSKAHAQGKFEMYDYPGEYEEAAHGTTLSHVRLEELHARYEVGHAQSNDRSMTVGSTFTMMDFPRSDWNKKYLVTSTSIHLTSDSFGTGGGSADPYSCSFTAIPAATQFRAPRLTPKPLIQGPQTAIVVGPKGEEIHTDKYGRIKVQFHWDRYGKADENSSCWARVSQAAWAGKKWGAMYIPRVGQEVIVEFLEGDPDWPIVTGRVYNADNMPPYDLPAEKTKTTLKSSSSKGGAGFNEFRFEDKKGSEQIFVHAEKDHDVRVKNVQKEWIGKDKHLVVKGDQMESVTGDKHLTVTGDQNEKVNGAVSLNVSMDLQQKVGMNHAVQSGMAMHLKAGMNIVIEAGLSITLKAGGGFIVIGPAGVTISGTPVLINSGGAAGAGAGCTPDPAKAPLEAATATAGTTNTVNASTSTKKTTTTDKVKISPRAAVLKEAAQTGAPFCQKC